MTPNEKALQDYIESTPYYGTCTYEYKEGIEDGAKWQLEKVKELLNKLLDENMCLVVGDELINEFLKQNP